MSYRIHFPYSFDGRGHTRTDEQEHWVRGLIEQVLFTAPGERVMRPGFGCSLRELLFAPNSPELTATTQYLVQSALQQWLEDQISVQSVTVEAVEARLTVTVQYTLHGEDETHEDRFVLGTTP
jgi:phage baseplate assembly protein W